MDAMFDTPSDLSIPSCTDAPGSPLCAADVTQQHPLDGGRRADLMGLDARGNLVIVEIKVSRADLLGDGKWPDYLPHCDRFYWAVPAGFDAAPLDTPPFLPERTGVIVADRYDAAIVREAHSVPLTAHGRRKCTLAFARRAARRLTAAVDPDADGLAYAP
jgi:hypothetical protein